eukprot:Rmarinus@m.27335
MPKDDVQKLFKECEKSISETTYRAELRQKSAESSVTMLCVFICTLYWFRIYPTFSQLAWFFGCAHPRTVVKWVSRGVQGMWRVLGPELDMPDHEVFVQEMERWKDCVHAFFPELCCFVDGSEFKVPCPGTGTMGGETSYSAKKKQYSRSFLVWVWLDGRIFHVSESMPGSHDQKQLIQETEAGRGATPFIGKKVRVGGDAGFALNTGRFPDVGMQPFKGIKLGEPNWQAKVAWTYRFSQFRVVVENSIRVIKAWNIGREKFRAIRVRNEKSVRRYDNAIRIVAILAKRKIEKAGGLRPPTWRPKKRTWEQILGYWLKVNRKKLKNKKQKLRKFENLLASMPKEDLQAPDGFELQ